MRFKEFLKETFILRDGAIRYVYSGTLDPDALYAGIPAYYYDDQHGWMHEYLDPGTKLEFKQMRDLKSEHADIVDFADSHASWLLDEVAAVLVHYPDNFGAGVEFYIHPRDLEKKTVDEATFKKLKLDWINSLKEAKKPRKIKDAPIVPVPNETYVVYADHPEIFDCMVVTKVPEQPKHGEQIPDNFFINIFNGEKIVFKHTLTNEHGKFAVIEWNGQTYYTPLWMFPSHVTTPQKYRQIQIDFMNSLKESEMKDPPHYSGEQTLIVDGEPFTDGIWGYENKPMDTRDAKKFLNGTKLLFQDYQPFYFTPHKERLAARCLIDGEEWMFRYETFDTWTESVEEYKKKKLDWMNSLKEAHDEEYVLTQNFTPSIMAATGYASNDLRVGTKLKIESIRSPYVYFSVEGQPGALFRMSKVEWNENTFKGSVRDWHKKFMQGLKDSDSK